MRPASIVQDQLRMNIEGKAHLGLDSLLKNYGPLLSKMMNSCKTKVYWCIETQLVLYL
jgi:hypothetical protein